MGIEINGQGPVSHPQGPDKRDGARRQGKAAGRNVTGGRPNIDYKVPKEQRQHAAQKPALLERLKNIVLTVVGRAPKEDSNVMYGPHLPRTHHEYMQSLGENDYSAVESNRAFPEEGSPEHRYLPDSQKQAKAFAAEDMAEAEAVQTPSHQNSDFDKELKRAASRFRGKQYEKTASDGTNVAYGTTIDRALELNPEKAALNKEIRGEHHLKPSSVSMARHDSFQEEQTIENFLLEKYSDSQSDVQEQMQVLMAMQDLQAFYQNNPDVVGELKNIEHAGQDVARIEEQLKMMSGESQTVRAQWSSRLQQAQEELEALKELLGKKEGFEELMSSLVKAGFDDDVQALPTAQQLQGMVLDKQHQVNMMRSNYLKPQLNRVEAELKDIQDKIGAAPQGERAQNIAKFQRLIDEIKTTIDAEHDLQGFQGTPEQLKSYIKDLKSLYKKMQNEVSMARLEDRRAQLLNTVRALRRLVTGFKTDEQVNQASSLSSGEKMLSSLVHTADLNKRDIKAHWTMAYKSVKAFKFLTAFKFCVKAVMLYNKRRKLKSRMAAIIPEVTRLCGQLGINPDSMMIRISDGRATLTPEAKTMMDRGWNLRSHYHYHGEGDITNEYETRNQYDVEVDAGDLARKQEMINGITAEHIELMKAISRFKKARESIDPKVFDKAAGPDWVAKQLEDTFNDFDELFAQQMEQLEKEKQESEWKKEHQQRFDSSLDLIKRGPQPSDGDTYFDAPQDDDSYK